MQASHEAEGLSSRAKSRQQFSWDHVIFFWHSGSDVSAHLPPDAVTDIAPQVDRRIRGFPVAWPGEIREMLSEN
jgi:hypothetical protein